MRRVNAGRNERIARHRRTVTRAGLVAIALATGSAAAACIFDEGTYQGGGHLDRGATAAQSTETAPPSDTTAPTSTASSTASTSAIPDAGAPGS